MNKCNFIKHSHPFIHPHTNTNTHTSEFQTLKSHKNILILIIMIRRQKRSVVGVCFHANQNQKTPCDLCNKGSNFSHFRQAYSSQNWKRIHVIVSWNVCELSVFFFFNAEIFSLSHLFASRFLQFNARINAHEFQLNFMVILDAMLVVAPL